MLLTNLQLLYNTLNLSICLSKFSCRRFCFLNNWLQKANFISEIFRLMYNVHLLYKSLYLLFLEKVLFLSEISIFFNCNFFQNKWMLLCQDSYKHRASVWFYITHYVSLTFCNAHSFWPSTWLLVAKLLYNYWCPSVRFWGKRDFLCR